jgi:hypothetical protein
MKPTGPCGLERNLAVTLVAAFAATMNCAAAFAAASHRERKLNGMALCADMLRPCRSMLGDQDAILRHVASWGDRIPQARK